MNNLHPDIIRIVYILASIAFIIGLKMMGSPATARRGNRISALGMLAAVIVTLLSQEILSYEHIAIGLGIGTIIGIFSARLVAMTEMPQMVAIFNGFGGIASLLVGWAVYQQGGSALAPVTLISIVLSLIIGGVAFSGSMIAWGKLGGWVSGRPLLFRGQKIVNLLILAVILGSGVVLAADITIPLEMTVVLGTIIGASLLFGITSVIPIGGADMPVVISLLNSYSGMAAAAAGFVIGNELLIIAGALVGASGIILTKIMCKAMNRSLANVLFSGFGSVSTSKGEEAQGEAKAVSVSDAYYVLEAAGSVLFVPGYGMAVAQAQHAVRELGELLEANGAEVRYAIHPVAGRMPGHMNVLLAEANVSYDQLVEPQDVNPAMETVDVAIIIGANDVVNPAARDDASSPIHGMPVIEADRAKTVFVLKRSMAAGFAGIPNPLFFKENTRMIFGDAKATISALVAEFKEG